MFSSLKSQSILQLTKPLKLWYVSMYVLYRLHSMLYSQGNVTAVHFPLMCCDIVLYTLLVDDLRI